MITHINNGKTFLLVEVPEDSSKLWISRTKIQGDHFSSWLHLKHKETENSVSNLNLSLPDTTATWKILGKASELSEEQCPYIVPVKGMTSVVIYYDFRDPLLWKYEAFDSLQTLLASHHLTAETTLILEKI